MGRSAAAEYWLAVLLRVIGGVCLLALVPLWMPRGWIVAAHRWLDCGPFPDSAVAEYLARSVSALSAFYGGLLFVLSTDVRRYAPVIRYQAAGYPDAVGQRGDSWELGRDAAVVCGR